ncbi:MAG: GAF domain-containing protein, partial [Anaerolineales bacterium]
ALREAGTTLGASLDFDTVLDRLMEQIARVTPYDAGNVMLVEDGYARVARLRGYAQFGPKVAQATANLRLEIATTPNLHRMAETGQPLVVPDTATDPEWIKVEASAHVHSWVGAPIRQQDQVIAFFSLDKVEPNFYRPEHAQRLAIFAGQAALALQNARLFAAQGQRAAELEAVRQASLSLTASLSLQPLLEAILETTLKFTRGAQDAHIFLYHPEQGGYLTFGAALRSDGQKGQPWASPRPNGLTYNVARQAQTIVVPDMRQHPLYADAPRDWHGAIIGLPLTIGERVVGVMNIAHPQPHAFPEAEVRVLRLLGDQAAIAIENARLFEAERIAREQAEALREVAGVLSADLDQQRLLRLILEQLARVVRYDSASIMLVEEGQLRLVAQRGFPFGKEPITPARVETLPHIQELIEHCRPVIISNTAADPRWRPTPGDNNVRCWMGVPLMAQDQVLGLLNLDKTQ